MGFSVRYARSRSNDPPEATFGIALSSRLIRSRLLDCRAFSSSRRAEANLFSRARLFSRNGGRAASATSSKWMGEVGEVKKARATVDANTCISLHQTCRDRATADPIAQTRETGQAKGQWDLLQLLLPRRDAMFPLGAHIAYP